MRAFCGAAETAAVQPRSRATGSARARSLQSTAREALDRGLTPTALERWTDTWTRSTGNGRPRTTQKMLKLSPWPAPFVGDRGVALTGFAPLKSEWLSQYLDALWQLVNQAEEPNTDADPGDAVSTATAIAEPRRPTIPPICASGPGIDALLPTSEGRLWSLYGGDTTRDESGFAGEALRSVVTQLLTLQPEAAGHLDASPGAQALPTCSLAKPSASSAPGLAVASSARSRFSALAQAKMTSRPRKPSPQ